MERRLQQLFDLQEFASNPRLAALIDDTCSRYSKPVELSEDEMEEIYAAGNDIVLHKHNLID